jgi:hypothetical protein
MSVLAIACDNCGAKYRLPESFSGDKAKCQKCGSVIDVAAQRKAAAAPAPIAAAPKETPAPKKAAPVRASKTEAKTDAAPAARSRRATAEPKADAKPGRGRKDAGEREPKKSNTMLLAGGGIAALAIIAVIVVLASGGKDKAKAVDTAQAAATPKPADATPEAKTPAAVDASADKGAPEAAAANSKPAASEAAAQKAAPAAVEAAPAPVAQDKKPAPEAPKAKPAESKQPEAQPAEPKSPEAKPTEDKPTGGGEAKERWEANKTTRLEDVYKPTELGDVTWPAECEQAQKDEIVSLIDDICNGGKPGVAAKPKLEKIGYYAIFGLVDRLRKLDYTSGDDQMTAWELNKSIEAIAAGMNAGFVAVEVGGDLDPRKADHNARTNIAWSRLLTKFTGKADFDTWRKERASKNK